MRTRVKITCVNKLEAMCERSRVNVKVKPRSELLCLRATFYTLPLIYLYMLILRAKARKNYATMENHP